MKSLALIMQDGLSSWMSCSRINRHLLSAYQLLDGYSVQLFNLKDQQRISYQIVQQLIQNQPEVVSFVDHRLSLLELLRFDELIQSLRESRATILIHVYGSFQVRLQEFELVSHALAGLDVRFVCGSQAQMRVLQSLYPKQTFISSIPFALKPSELAYSPPLREQLRIQLNYSPDDQVLLYLGRISFDKNVELAIHCAELARERNPKLKFLIVGPMDDYNLAFDNQRYRYRGYEAAVFANYLESRKSWVRWLPQIEEPEVRGFLSAADGLITLSTQKGEDYGMVVPEALSSGLKTIVTEWGGYQEFLKLGNVIGCPVMMNPLSLETEHVVDALSELKSSKREEAAASIEAAFGVPAYAKKLKALLEASPKPLLATRFETDWLSHEEVARRGYV